MCEEFTMDTKFKMFTNPKVDFKDGIKYFHVSQKIT